jgi:hypothetical protein
LKLLRDVNEREGGGLHEQEAARERGIGVGRRRSLVRRRQGSVKRMLAKPGGNDDRAEGREPHQIQQALRQLPRQDSTPAEGLHRIGCRPERGHRQEPGVCAAPERIRGGAAKTDQAKHEIAVRYEAEEGNGDGRLVGASGEHSRDHGEVDQQTGDETYRSRRLELSRADPSAHVAPGVGFELERDRDEDVEPREEQVAHNVGRELSPEWTPGGDVEHADGEPERERGRPQVPEAKAGGVRAVAEPELEGRDGDEDERHVGKVPIGLQGLRREVREDERRKRGQRQKAGGSDHEVALECPPQSRRPREVSEAKTQVRSQPGKTHRRERSARSVPPVGTVSRSGTELTARGEP